LAQSYAHEKLQGETLQWPREAHSTTRANSQQETN